MQSEGPDKFPRHLASNTRALDPADYPNLQYTSSWTIVFFLRNNKIHTTIEINQFHPISSSPCQFTSLRVDSFAIVFHMLKQETFHASTTPLFLNKGPRMHLWNDAGLGPFPLEGVSDWNCSPCQWNLMALRLISTSSNMWNYSKITCFSFIASRKWFKHVNNEHLEASQWLMIESLYLWSYLVDTIRGYSTQSSWHGSICSTNSTHAFWLDDELLLMAEILHYLGCIKPCK